MAALLRPLYARYESQCVVTRDEPDNYYLSTHQVREKDGYRTGFGGVEIKKSYVSAHLMPVYVHPDLLDGIGETLRKRMQGKSCFNFRKRDDEVFEDLSALIARSVARFEEDGIL